MVGIVNAEVRVESDKTDGGKVCTVELNCRHIHRQKFDKSRKERRKAVCLELRSDFESLGN
jgi:hypothetical protein